MDVVTILVLAGVGLIIAALLGGGIEIKEIRVPTLSKPVRIASALVGAGMLGAGYYVDLQTTPDIPRPETMSATFEYPAPNARISLKTELGGTLKPTSPDGGKYWVIIRDDDGDYYPQSAIAASQVGTWTHSLVLGPAWKDRTLNALIVFAPRSAEEILLRSVGEEALSGLPKNMVVIAELGLTVE